MILLVYIICLKIQAIIEEILEEVQKFSIKSLFGFLFPIVPYLVYLFFPKVVHVFIDLDIDAFHGVSPDHLEGADIVLFHMPTFIPGIYCP